MKILTIIIKWLETFINTIITIEVYMKLMEDNNRHLPLTGFLGLYLIKKHCEILKYFMKHFTKIFCETLYAKNFMTFYI